MGAREWYLSCPAVSQISNLTVVSSRQTVWVRNAAPMVDWKQWWSCSPLSGVCLPLGIHETVPSQTAGLTKTFLLLIHLKENLFNILLSGPVTREHKKLIIWLEFAARRTCFSLLGLETIKSCLAKPAWTGRSWPVVLRVSGQQPSLRDVQYRGQREVVEEGGESPELLSETELNV